MTNTCFVCDRDIDETIDEVSRVTEKRITSLVIASMLYGFVWCKINEFVQMVINEVIISLS